MLHFKKVIFFLTSISSGWELQSVNHFIIHENSKFKVFKTWNVNYRNIFLDDISNNWSKKSFGTNVCKILISCS